GQRTQLRVVASDELQVRRLGRKEVAADIDTNRGGRAVSHKFRELGAVAAADIEHRPAGDITHKLSLRGPLDEPIERVFLRSGPLVIRSEVSPRLAWISGTAHVRLLGF